MFMMKFAHIEKTSLSDYPGRVCSLLYTVGCNFRCPFCYNASLVIPEKYPKHLINENDVIKTLVSRKKIIDSVAITGGEPSMHGQELLDFLSKLKQNGFYVKLDTNGTNPDLIKQTINDKLVDYFAVDIKSAKNEYAKAVGISNPLVDKIEETIKLIISSGIGHDFRTTIVPGIHSDAIMEKIGQWLNSLGENKRYVMQTFYMPDNAELVDPGFAPGLFKKQDIRVLVNAVKPYFEKVEVRDYIYMDKY